MTLLRATGDLEKWALPGSAATNPASQ